MANKKLEIMEIRRILRLHHSGRSKRFIAEYLGLSRNTVNKYLDLFALSGYTYEELLKRSDQQLNKLFESKITTAPANLVELERLFPVIDRELKRPGMTKQMQWEAYYRTHPNGYKSTQFVRYYNLWKKSSSPSMHMNHKAGEMVFIDYAGHKMRIVDKITGKQTPVEVFLAVLGASQYTYIEASLSQKKDDFIRSSENTFLYFGGVSQAIVPDNLKSAVTKADRYEPKINEAFLDFAEHYGTVIYPARVRKPKDKALVENAVRIAYQRIFAPLSKKVFFSLESLNKAILEKLEEYNNTPLTRKGKSRRELFEEMEKQVLKPLPSSRYQIKQYAMGTVYKNCHVCLQKDGHYYSVPYYYLRKKVKIVYSQDDVKIFHNYNLIATHKRDRAMEGYTTVTEHLPEKHQYILNLSPEKLIDTADEIGTHTRELIIKILEEGRYPAAAFRSCSGVINLARKVGNIRVENACKRALDYKQHNYRIVNTILEKGLDKITDGSEDEIKLPDHKNIRGKRNYK
jgi:transposase